MTPFWAHANCAETSSETFPKFCRHSINFYGRKKNCIDGTLQLNLWMPYTIKFKLLEPFVLTLLQPHRRYIIGPSTPVHALEAIFLQQYINSNLNEWAKSSYWGRTISQTERSYSATERKCVEVEWAVQSLRLYIKRILFKLQKNP